MKRLLMLALAAGILTATVAVAQDAMKSDSMKSTSTKAMSIMGKIGADGTTFVADKDGKSWTIDNPDAVKGHEGHHVSLKAHADADKGSVHVVSLKMAKDSMSKDSMSKDNMKQ